MSVNNHVRETFVRDIDNYDYEADKVVKRQHSKSPNSL